MSGTNGTNGATEMAPDVSVTPDTTIPDEQGSLLAPGQGASATDVLTQSEWTRRLVAGAAIVTVCLCVLMAVGVMAYRVAIDGNTPLTTDISGKLTWIALSGFVAMIAALFGSNNLIAKMIEKVIP